MSNKTLQEIAKGAGLVFVGTFTIYLLKFIYRLIVSRYLGPSDYGLLSLGDGILNIAFLFSIIGLSSGLLKYVPHYIGKDNLEKVKGMIITTFKIVIPLSFIITIGIIVFSDYIAIGIFNNARLGLILIILALAVPFYATSNLLTGIFMAFKKVQYRNYLNAFMRPFSALIIVMIIIFLKGNIYHIAGALLLSHILTSLLGFYLLEFKTFPIIKSKIRAIYNYKKILAFSLPLFFSDIFMSFMGWIDTFFLGVFKTTTDVGIYNVVLPLVSTLTIFLSAFGNIFLPISSELYAKNDHKEIARTYSSVSRWMFILSLPVLFTVLFFSEEILKILFGEAYISGAFALQILILAYFARVVAGPAPQALMTFNKTKLLFYINSIAAIINFVLNYILIPKYGLIGAAIATAPSLLFRDCTLFIFAKVKLQFKYSLKLYFKYFVSAISPILIIFFFIKEKIEINLFTLIMIIIVYLIIYFTLLIILQSFTEDDLMIICAIEKKTGISLKLIKKLIK
jgi:O-antigen/teichoic acid export membrane protein